MFWVSAGSATEGPRPRVWPLARRLVENSIVIREWLPLGVGPSCTDVPARAQTGEGRCRLHPQGRDDVVPYSKDGEHVRSVR